MFINRGLADNPLQRPHSRVLSSCHSDGRDLWVVMCQESQALLISEKKAKCMSVYTLGFHACFKIFVPMFFSDL